MVTVNTFYAKHIKSLFSLQSVIALDFEKSRTIDQQLYRSYKWIRYIDINHKEFNNDETITAVQFIVKAFPQIVTSDNIILFLFSKIQNPIIHQTLLRKFDRMVVSQFMPMDYTGRNDQTILKSIIQLAKSRNLRDHTLFEDFITAIPVNIFSSFVDDPTFAENIETILEIYVKRERPFKTHFAEKLQYIFERIEDRELMQMYTKCILNTLNNPEFPTSNDMKMKTRIFNYLHRAIRILYPDAIDAHLQIFAIYSANSEYREFFMYIYRTYLRDELAANPQQQVQLAREYDLDDNHFNRTDQTAAESGQNTMTN
jgi:hypothetical protein